MKNRVITRTLCLLLSFVFVFVGVACKTGEQPDDESSNMASDTEASTDMEPTGPSEEDDLMTKSFPVEPISCENITINAYLVPLQDEVRQQTLALCRDADVDVLSHVYFAPHWVEEDHTYEAYKQLMADAAEYGLTVLTMDTTIQHCADMTDEELIAYAKTYADLPGFGGFFVVDEPGNPDVYARIENVLRTVCHDTRINVNFLPRGCYPEGDYIRQLTDYGALLNHTGWLSLDAYCFPVDGGINESSLFLNYNDLRVAGLRTGCNTAVYVQAIGMDGAYRRPTGNDLRCNMMSAVAYGMKELKFFCWGTPPREEGSYSSAILDRKYQPTALYNEVCKINKKIHALGTTLAKCDAVEVYHSRETEPDAYDLIPNDLFVQTDADANVILSLFRERNGTGEYVMLVSKNLTENQTVTLTFKDIEAVSVLDEVTGAPIPQTLSAGTLTLTLAPGDGTVICLPEGLWFPSDTVAEQHDNENLALGCSVFASSSVGTDGFYLYNLTDGVTTGTGTRLSSVNGETPWAVIDLGRTCRFNRIDLYPSGDGELCGAQNPSDLTLEVSADGKKWTSVWSHTGEQLSRGQVTVATFSEVSARYVRISILGLDRIINSADIGEVAVYRDDGSMETKLATGLMPVSFYEGMNVAQNKPVLAWSSTTDVTEWKYHHSYLVDGKTNTSWASEINRNEQPDAEEWVVIDLCNEYVIDRAELMPGSLKDGINGFPSDYQLLVSQNGRDFTPVASVTGDNDPPSEKKRVLTFDPITARYIMLKATRLTKDAADGKYTVEISELEIYGKPLGSYTLIQNEGPNLAYGSHVTAWSSTIDMPEWTCHHDYIVDDDKSTAWASELNRNASPESEEWIIIDLGDVKNVDRVKLIPREIDRGYNVFPTDYAILVSTDGENFTQVVSVTGDNEPVSSETRVLSFTPTPARYIKLLATRLSYQPNDNQYGIEISEMEVYAVADAQIKKFVSE